MNELISARVSKMFDFGGVKSLGWLCFWSVSDFLIPYTDLQKILEDSGIERKIKSTQLRTAITKAMDDVVDQLKAQGHKAFVKKLATSENKSVFSWGVIQQIEDKENLDSDFVRQTKVVYNRDEVNVKIIGPHESFIQERVQVYLNSYSGAQFRESFVEKFVAENLESVCLRKSQGGVYFIRKDKRQDLESMLLAAEKVNEQIGDRVVDIHLVPIADVEQGRQELQQSTADSIRSEMASLKADLDKYEVTSDMPEARRKQYENMANERFAEYRQLKTKIEAYEQLLSFTASDLHAQLESLEDSVSRNLLGRSA
jgi:hypothetical protein